MEEGALTGGAARSDSVVAEHATDVWDQVAGRRGGRAGLGAGRAGFWAGGVALLAGPARLDEGEAESVQGKGEGAGPDWAAGKDGLG